MKRSQVLVIEDDSAVRLGIVDALEFEGYHVLEAGDGDRALELALHTEWDLMLLDLVIPGLDGMSILKEVRRTSPNLPVIILTARGEESDRVRGLRMGADDYVVKPFSVRELLARVEAVLRRSPERPLDVSSIDLPSGVVDLKRCEVKFADGGRSELSPREVDLLRYLAGQRGRVISREELLTRLWRVDPRRVETRTIDMHVARLRDKLRDISSEPAVLLTVRGKGYMLADSNGSAPG